MDIEKGIVHDGKYYATFTYQMDCGGINYIATHDTHLYDDAMKLVESYKDTHNIIEVKLIKSNGWWDFISDPVYNYYKNKYNKN